MRAQMFIITMVFLAGLIVFVQQMLIQYHEVDVSKGFEKVDLYILESIRDMFNKTLENSECCDNALLRIEELDSFLKRMENMKYFLELRYNNKEYVNLNCENYNTNNSVLSLNVKITTGSSESSNIFHFFGMDRSSPSITNVIIIPDIKTRHPDGTVFNITALIRDCSGIKNESVVLQVKLNENDNPIDVRLMHDDGKEGDIVGGDNIYTALWNSSGFCINPFGCIYYMDIIACDVFDNCKEMKNI